MSRKFLGLAVLAALAVVGISFSAEAQQWVCGPNGCYQVSAAPAYSAPAYSAPVTYAAPAFYGGGYGAGSCGGGYAGGYSAAAPAASLGATARAVEEGVTPTRL